MAKFKYIIVEHREMELPIVFSKFFDHRSLVNGQKVVSAGFLSVDKNCFLCFGESVGLKIKSRPAIDSEIIRRDYEFQA